MTEYADPELLVGRWLQTKLKLKFWMDPRPPGNQPFTSALVHFRRGAGGDDLALTLDAPLFDCDVYAADPDHARNAQNAIWSAVMFDLPLTTFDKGVFVKSASTPTKPFWAPDPKVSRRTAVYRIILHGLI